ncbi:MAG: hypothetical protein NZM25_05110 [Leptospiraceae bacterium]|nr:hypothetical protein [Leptospiraceae bacterium]MDW8305613.1 hypothetical protein [Leptospiraceae bacterium]
MMHQPGDYFISLGAGENQLPLIEAAKKLGFRIIGVDRNIDAIGFPLCDIRIEESIHNYRRIFLKINLGTLDGNIVGGYCASYGKAILSWAYLAERLNLPFISRTLAEKLLDKLYIRRELQKLRDEFFAQPGFLSLENHIYRDDLEKLGYPVIVKTRGGYAKKNIYQLNRYADARSFLTRRNLRELGIEQGELLLEKKIPGDEIIVTGFVRDFRFYLVSITDKVAMALPPFLDLLHEFPSRYEGEKEKLEKIHQKIVDILEIPLSPLVSEWIVHEGKFYLIEMSPQIPGEFLPTFLIPEGLHYDYFENLVRLVTGKDIDLPRPSSGRRIYVRYFDRPPSQEYWQKVQSAAVFTKILNEPRKEVADNTARYAVAGFRDVLPQV